MEIKTHAKERTIDSIVSSLNGLLGEKGKSLKILVQSHGTDCAGQSYAFALVGRLFEGDVKYVVIMNSPQWQQATHAPYGIYDILGTRFQIVGDIITEELIQQLQRNYDSGSAAEVTTQATA